VQSPTGQQHHARAQEADDPHSLLAPTQRALLHRLARGQAHGRLPSAVAVVVRDGAIAWSGARGTAGGDRPTADTQYRIASLTKMFVAVAVLRLRDESRVRLTDRLADHLPGTDVGELRIGELLAHTSGLESDPPGPWWERAPRPAYDNLSELAGESPRRHPAGRRFHYSNVGYAMLGALVSQIRGKHWTEVVRDEVLTPLGLTRTAVKPDAPYARGWAVHPWADLVTPEPAHDVGLMGPAGGFWSTAGDLARFAAFLAGESSDVLSEDSLHEMREPAAPSDDAGLTGTYGLGLQIERSPDGLRYGHCGSVPGFISALWVNENGTAGITLANATSPYPLGALASDLIEIVERHEPSMPPEWHPMPAAAPAKLAVTGIWYWGPIPHAVRLHARNDLSLSPLGADDSPAWFRATADGSWKCQNGFQAGETLRPVIRPDGSVSHLDIGTYIFTREPYDDLSPIPGGTDPAGWRSL
jgi:CubicO group peptidase (beta-lactamase class C family)